MTEVLTNNNNNNNDQNQHKNYNNVQQSFDINLDEIPLSALGTKCRKTLSILLNPTKVLLSEEGLPRDWRGVMHFSGLSHQYGPLLSNKADPLDELLKIWCNQSTITTPTSPSVISSNNNNYYNEAQHQQFVDNISLAQFQRILGTIDRWDVIDDTNNFFLDDAERYLNIKLKSDIANRNQNNSNENSSVYFNPDANILTIDDAALAKQGLPPQLYDAFVLYADEDIDFATEIIEKMENYGLKLCVRERDLIGGISFEHEAILRLISDRCTRLIVVVSPSFFKSPANTFFVNFAQALGIEQRKRKIIPCQYETCLLPPTLSYFFLLNYQRSGRLYNFWEKLKDSIQSSPVELAAAINNNNSLPRITITEMDSTTTTINQQNNQTTRLSIMPSKSKISNNTINNSNNNNNNKNTIVNNINANHNNNNNNNINKNDNRINEHLPTTPIAAPRKRKDKKYLSNEKLLAQRPIPQIVIALHHDDKIKAKSSTNLQNHNHNNNNENENIDQINTSEKRIWPPPPKLRTTTSMWNLSSINAPLDNNNNNNNNQHIINSNSNYDISKSTISLNTTTNRLPPSPTIKSDAKKPKWYKKLLLPNSPIRIPSDSETETSTTNHNHNINNNNNNINIKEKEKKRKWFRKKIASLS